MENINFEIIPYVADSWSISITREIPSDNKSNTLDLTAHKIDGEIIFEGLNGDEWLLGKKEQQYLSSMLNC